MSNPSQAVGEQFETLLEIGRQKAKVVREFDRATLAQIRQVQTLVEENPDLLSQYRDVLIRGERIRSAANYLSTLKIPGYTPEELGEINPSERDRAAVFMSIFAPQDAEFSAWAELTGFDLGAAVGRLGIAAAEPDLSNITLAPITATDSTLSEPASDEADAPTAIQVPALPNPEEKHPEGRKRVVKQVLFDDVLLHLSDDARDVLLAFKTVSGRVTVGRLRKALGSGHENDDPASLIKLMKQVNAEYAKTYESELIEVLGGGWYQVDPSNIGLITTQEVLVDVVEDDGPEVVELASKDIVRVFFKGKTVQLDHTIQYAIFKLLSDSQAPISSETILAHPSIKAYGADFNETQLKDAVRNGLSAIQQHFAYEYGIEITTSREGAKLPNEFSRQEGILLIEGMRRGRRYSISAKHKKELRVELVVKSGEVLTDNRSEEEIEAERLTNVKRVAVKVYAELHRAVHPLGLEEVARNLIEADHDGEVSSSEAEAYTQLVFAAFKYLTEQQGLFKSRGTELKVLSPREGDPIKYQIIDLVDTPGVSVATDISESMAARRARLQAEREHKPGEGDKVGTVRTPKVQDGENRLYATHAIIDRARVEFTPHEAAVLAILSIQPSKTPIQASQITGILRNTDSSVTRGDIDAALEGLKGKLNDGWILEDPRKSGGPGWRLGKNVNIKSPTR